MTATEPTTNNKQRYEALKAELAIIEAKIQKNLNALDILPKLRADYRATINEMEQIINQNIDFFNA